MQAGGDQRRQARTCPSRQNRNADLCASDHGANERGDLAAPQVTQRFIGIMRDASAPDKIRLSQSSFALAHSRDDQEIAAGQLGTLGRVSAQTQCDIQPMFIHGGAVARIIEDASRLPRGSRIKNLAVEIQTPHQSFNDIRIHDGRLRSKRCGHARIARYADPRIPVTDKDGTDLVGIAPAI